MYSSGSIFPTEVNNTQYVVVPCRLMLSLYIILAAQLERQKQAASTTTTKNNTTHAHTSTH